MKRVVVQVGALVLSNISALSIGCSLRALDELESATLSECEPALRAQCARAGASCDRVASLLGEPTPVCRWEDVSSEEQCATETFGAWMTTHSPWALDHPNSVAPEVTGACIGESPGTAVSARVELCFEFQAAFLANGGDFPLPDENEPARGVRFRVTDGSGLASQHDADPVTGCKTLELDGLARYEVTVLSQAALADGNQIQLKLDDSQADPFEWTATTSLVPSVLPEARVRYVWPADPLGNGIPHVSTVMAALVRTVGTRALTRGETYRAYFEGSTCRLPCVESDRSGASSVYLPDPRVDKFAISNMVALLATQQRLGGEIGSVGGDLPDCSLAAANASRCANGATHVAGTTGFEMGTEEYGNCAFIHGWSHYVATSVWNRPDEPNCDYKQQNPFGDCYEPGSAAAHCYDGLEPSLLGIGFERDWLTALWALERFDGCAIPFPIIADILTSANPRAWTNASARSALIAAAPPHLSRSAFECLETTLTTRVIH